MPRSCVIFDFDGVIADTERLHLAAYNETFALRATEVGGTLEITADVYFSRYIVYSNREGFRLMLQDAGLRHDEVVVDELCRVKDEIFESRLGDFAEPLPGVRDMLAWLESKGVPRAICSGARRQEIEILLEAFGLRRHFDVMVAIEDVRVGKPDPEGYNAAFAKLNEKSGGKLEKGRSLVVEDSAGGCAAARAAGIRVLGVATSLTVERLRGCADYAVRDLGELDHGELGRWLGV